MTEANDKLTALERALSELRHAQGAWQVNHLNLKFVAELNAAEDALIEAARAEGRAAAANEHPTCATCAANGPSCSIRSAIVMEYRRRGVPMAVCGQWAVDGRLHCAAHTPRAEEGEK